jgi:sugar lactone lactonase YvrE
VTKALLIAVSLLVPAMAADQPAPWPRRAIIKPSLVRLAPGAEQRFKTVLSTARLMAATPPKSVRWSVNDIPGGNAEVGTIDEFGMYRAPAKIPVPNEVHICAVVEGAVNPHLWATALLGRPGTSYKIVNSFSEPESGGRLKGPHGISVDGDSLLIADQTAGRVFRYSKDGKFLAEIGSGQGADSGQFTEPRFALADKDGNIFVTDLKGDRPRLQVFNRQGTLVRIFAEKGMQPGMILRGHGLAFDPQGRLFTTDVDNQRICAFSKTGEFLFCWGKEGPNLGQFNAPHGLYLDANGDVFVNGYYGPTQKFSPNGDYLLGFAFGDPPDGSVYYHSLTGDRWGNIFVTVRTKAGYNGALESNRGKKVSIEKYNNNGDFICNMSLSVPEHTESWATVDDDGTVYALFKGRTSSGVEIFRQQ